MAENTITPINAAAATAGDLRRMHHLAAEELFEEAISLLSFMELAGQVEHEDFSVLGKVVGDMAAAIVEKLVKAQGHHRESL